MKEFCFVCGKKLGFFSDASYIHPDYPMCSSCLHHDLTEVFRIPTTTDNKEIISKARGRINNLFAFDFLITSCKIR